MRLHKSEWNQRLQKVKGNHPLATQYNLKLTSTKSDVLSIYNHFEVNKEIVSADKIKSIYKGETRKRVTFKDLFDEYIEIKKPSTLTAAGYKRRYEMLFKYVGPAYPDEVTRVSLTRMEAAMIKEGYSPAYIYKSRSAVKMLVDFGASMGYLESRITSVKLTLKRTYSLECLTFEEVQTLGAFVFSSPIFQKVVDIYLFSCFTGLSYVDLGKYEIVTTPERRYIKGKRTKTKTEYFAPLLEFSEILLEKYNGMLPKVSNQRCNMILKEALPLAGIDKKMKFHSGRKTFANCCINTLLYSKDATAKMMGQKDTKELLAYAEVDKNRVIAETTKLIA